MTAKVPQCHMSLDPFLLVLSACNSTRLTRLLMPVRSETQGIFRVRKVVNVRQEKQPKMVLSIGHGYLKVRSAWLSCMIYHHVDATKYQATIDSPRALIAQCSVMPALQHVNSITTGETFRNAYLEECQQVGDGQKA